MGTGGPRLAIVHERFTEVGGSERVVAALRTLWPGAAVFAPIADPQVTAAVLGGPVNTSPLQALYGGGPRYAHLLPLLPVAMGRLEVGAFDVVIASHHAFANRVRPGPHAIMVSYVHTPARWAWDAGLRGHEAVSRPGAAALAAFSATQRAADRRAARRPDVVVANSRHVADRVRRWWGRQAVVIAPPVDTEFFTPAPPDRRPFFLLAGRLVPYKRPEVAVAAATRAGVRLVVAGDGRARRQCEAVAGPGVEFLGTVDNETLRHLMRTAQALVHPGEEDFGMVPVEAQACGAPVIARAVGGVLDTVVDGVTGVLYPAGGDEVGALADVLARFDGRPFTAATIRRHAEQFSLPRFQRAFSELIDALWAGRSAPAPAPALSAGGAP